MLVWFWILFYEMLQLTNKINNTVCDTERAGGFHTSTDIFDRGLHLVRALAVGLSIGVCDLLLQIAVVLFCQTGEAGDESLSDERLGGVQGALLGDLDLELAAAEFEVHELLNTRGFGGRGDGLVLGDDIATGDTEVDPSLADEGGNVGGGQEDEGERQVLDQGDVEAVVAVELDVGAGQQLGAGLIQAALLRDCEEQTVVQAADEVSQGGQGAAEAAWHGAIWVDAGSVGHGGRRAVGEAVVVVR